MSTAKKGGPKAKKGGSKVKQNGSKAIYNLQTEKLCEVDRTSTHHDATAQGKGHRHFDWKSLPADKGIEAYSEGLGSESG